MRKIKLADGTVVFIEKGASLPHGASEVEEQAQDLGALIAKEVQKALEPIKETLSKTKATSNMEGMPTATPAPSGEYVIPEGARITGGNEAVEGKGINLARWTKAIATAKLTGMEPHEVAKSWGYARVAQSLKQQRETVQKALAQGTVSAGGALVPTEFSNEFIELLRNKTVIRAAGARVLPMGASLEIPKQTGAGTHYWGQENTAITASSQTFGKVVLQEKKSTALTEVSNDLIRNASPGAEELVRDDLINVVAIAEDLAFLRGSGASGEPQGIRYRTHSDHIYAETITTPGSPTLQEAKKELQKAIHKLRSANVPMTKCAWIFSPRTEKGMMHIVGPGGEGYNSLEREMAEKGTLRGYPVFVTQQVPENTGGGSDSELYLVDFDQVIIGESMALELAVFPNGGDDGITKDQTRIRAIRKVDLVMRHDKAAAIVNDISWA